MTHHSRRDFMRLACCSAATASIVGGLSKFGLVSAMAQGTTDYKALVCMFLFGGNDAKNLSMRWLATLGLEKRLQ